VAVFDVSLVDVASEALGQLGRAPISSLDDTDDPVAVQCKRYLLSLLRAMLRDHPWNFAKRRIALAQSATAPLSEWAYAYALPADCFRVLQVNNSDRAVWEVEGRELLSDESTIVIEYIKWEDDPNRWDGMFYQCLVTSLTVRLAPALNTDKEKASDLFKLAHMQLMDAKAVDGQEQSQQVMRATDLTDDIRDE